MTKQCSAQVKDNWCENDAAEDDIYCEEHMEEFTHKV